MKSLVAPDLLEAIQNKNIPSWCKAPLTSVHYVNWRKESVQIKFGFNDSEALEVYVDFKAPTLSQSIQNRDRVLKTLFSRHSPKEKPFEDRFGYIDWSFIKRGFVSPNEAVEIAQSLGLEVSVIYKSTSKREMLADIGLPIVAGETGKEWIDGNYQSYRPRSGMNL